MDGGGGEDLTRVLGIGLLRRLDTRCGLGLTLVPPGFVSVREYILILLHQCIGLLGCFPDLWSTERVCF